MNRARAIRFSSPPPQQSREKPTVSPASPSPAGAKPPTRAAGEAPPARTGAFPRAPSGGGQEACYRNSATRPGAAAWPGEAGLPAWKSTCAGRGLEAGRRWHRTPQGAGDAGDTQAAAVSEDQDARSPGAGVWCRGPWPSLSPNPVSARQSSGLQSLPPSRRGSTASQS